MIPIVRGTEPTELRRARMVHLPALKRLEKTRALMSRDIKGYEVAGQALWQAQHHKCCYCEHKIQKPYNDVEHFRPKVSADRKPGCLETHGYWWLAFTWGNLLYSCPACNRSAKNDRFPLQAGSVALETLRSPPGGEIPLLLNPAEDNGVEHIEFVFTLGPSLLPSSTRPVSPQVRKRWRPRARGGSPKGMWTIHVVGLDADEYLEIYDSHVNKDVRPIAEELCSALTVGRDAYAIRTSFERALRLLEPARPFVGLSYDALRELVPTSLLAPARLAWPSPQEVGRPTVRKRRRTP